MKIILLIFFGISIASILPLLADQLTVFQSTEQTPTNQPSLKPLSKQELVAVFAISSVSTLVTSLCTFVISEKICADKKSTIPHWAAWCATIPGALVGKFINRKLFKERLNKKHYVSMKHELKSMKHELKKIFSRELFNTEITTSNGEIAGILGFSMWFLLLMRAVLIEELEKRHN